MFVYKIKRDWYRFLLPVWMNRVSYMVIGEKELNTKIYRWLIFGWIVNG